MPEPAGEVVESADNRGRRDDPPISVEGQEGERGKNEEVSLGASVADTDEQGAKAHLGDGDRMACHRRIRAPPHQADRGNDEEGAEAEDERREREPVEAVGSACGNEGDHRPLGQEQPAEEPVEPSHALRLRLLEALRHVGFALHEPCRRPHPAQEPRQARHGVHDPGTSPGVRSGRRTPPDLGIEGMALA